MPNQRCATTFLLDLFTFYQYKFLKKDVSWLNNLYIINTCLTLFFFFYNFLKSSKVLQIFFFVSFLALLSKLLFEYLVLGNYLVFNTNCWLWLQAYIVINSILVVYFAFKESSKNMRMSFTFSYFALAFFISFSFPTLINLLMPFFKSNSKLLYTASLIMVNLLGLVFSILISIGHIELLSKNSLKIGKRN